MSGGGLIGLDIGPDGATIADNTRTPRLFKILSGSNPYTADEVQLRESDGTRPATGIYDLTSSAKQLWEVNGVTTVAANKIVVGFPNPAGTGFYFVYPDNGTRQAIDICVEKNGSGYVTDVRITYLNPDGTTDCETASACVGSTCDDLWWCTDTGVVSEPGGTEPATWLSGPYLTYAAAVAACETSSGEPAGGTISCGGCINQTLNSVLTVTLVTYGSFTVTWDGLYWKGSKALSCGETMYFRMNTACGMEFSCNDVAWGAVAVAGLSYNCGPPFSLTAASMTANMDSALAGCAPGSCGVVTISSISE